MRTTYIWLTGWHNHIKLVHTQAHTLTLTHTSRRNVERQISISRTKYARTRKSKYVQNFSHCYSVGRSFETSKTIYGWIFVSLHIHFSFMFLLRQLLNIRFNVMILTVSIFAAAFCQWEHRFLWKISNSTFNSCFFFFLKYPFLQIDPHPTHRTRNYLNSKLTTQRS